MKKLSSILAVITMIFTAPLAVHSADPTVVHIGGIKIFDHIPFPDGKKFGQDVDFNCSIPLKGNPKKNLRDFLEAEIRANKDIQDLITEKTAQAFANYTYGQDFFNTFAKKKLLNKLRKTYPINFERELKRYYVIVSKVGVVSRNPKSKQAVEIDRKALDSVTVEEALAKVPDPELLVFMKFSPAETAKK